MKNLSVFDKHQLNIAYKTLKMSDVGAKIIGGMTKEQARDIIKKFTGKAPKESMTKARELLNQIKEDNNKTLVIPKTKYSDNLKVTVINPDDLYSDGGPFWKHTYIIAFPFGAFLVNADNEGDAIDEFIDWAVKNAPGYLFTQEEESEMSDEERDEYISGGNNGRVLNETPDMEEVKPDVLKSILAGGK